MRCVVEALAMWRGVVFGAAMLAGAGGVSAQEVLTVPVETAEVGGNVVTLRLYPFLTEEEVTLLRVVVSNAEALALFVPEAGGHAALAVAPEEGFVRDGVPVPSAIAVGQLPDAGTARASATEQCNAARARKKDPECLVVLEVAPVPLP